MAVAGYANDYVGYVATREEYEVQHYEGAATLFGPWTQAGYQQEFARLAADIAAGRPSATHEPPADVRGVGPPHAAGHAATTIRPPAPSSATSSNDAQRALRCRRDRRRLLLERPSAKRLSARPRYMPPSSGKQDGAWQPVALDGDWEVKVRWRQPPENRSRTAPHVCRVEWDIPPSTPPGTYRIVHTACTSRRRRACTSSPHSPVRIK